MRVAQMRQRTKMLQTSDPVLSIHSSRSNYGAANQGVGSSDIEDGRWVWK